MILYGIFHGLAKQKPPLRFVRRGGFSCTSLEEPVLDRLSMQKAAQHHLFTAGPCMYPASPARPLLKRNREAGSRALRGVKEGNFCFFHPAVI